MENIDWLTSIRWGPTTDQAFITWIRGRPLRTVFSITSPIRCKSNNWKPPDWGPVLPREDWLRRGHHSFTDPEWLEDAVCCDNVENNCTCDAATRAAKKLVRACRFNFRAASSSSLKMSQTYKQQLNNLPKIQKVHTHTKQNAAIFWQGTHCSTLLILNTGQSSMSFHPKVYQ